MRRGCEKLMNDDRDVDVSVDVVTGSTHLHSGCVEDVTIDSELKRSIIGCKKIRTRVDEY